MVVVESPSDGQTLLVDSRLFMHAIQGHEPERLAQHKVTWEERSTLDGQ